MQIADGQPADKDDLWFRVLTDESYIKKGKIHPHAFKGKGVISVPPPEKERPWDRELSGRLRSLTDDVVSEAVAYCTEMTRLAHQTKRFSGVMFCSVTRADQEFENSIQTRIHYTPLLSDVAHADLTFTGPTNMTEAMQDRLRLWLCNIVIGLHTEQVRDLLPTSKVSRYRYCPLGKHR